MKKYEKILKNCALFGGIDDTSISVLLSCLGAQVKSFRKNDTLVTEGAPAKTVGVMLSGGAQIIRVDYYGNRTIVGEIQPSEIFGESFACAGVEEIPVSVVAQEDADILFLDVEKILSVCTNSCGFHRQVVYNLMKIMAWKNLAFHQKIEITSKRFTREKLMTYLMFQAQKQGSNRFYIPFDRQALADYLEVERSGLSTEIGKLKKEGVLKSNKNYFELL